ncbi:hypothetical protein ONZ43_g1081 [Nemania bipapillata]|uniref:Uncharacterized protein n=1 Tax=Nemania bipapillata TaxID=110536 RepID=A0ACC2J5V8_9PEZI|nr:hypothetical protein ONZ43_g1081 [Nemania bipapillata]
MLTQGPAVLNPTAIALCLISMAAQQAIIRRPLAITYLISMGSSLLALVISGIALIFEQSFQSYVEGGRSATGTTFTTTDGPLAYAVTLALGFQLAACVVGFYTCIGGKYQCEGGIRLEDVNLESGIGEDRSTIDARSSVDEKRPS